MNDNVALSESSPGQIDPETARRYFRLNGLVPDATALLSDPARLTPGRKGQLLYLLSATEHLVGRIASLDTGIGRMEIEFLGFVGVTPEGQIVCDTPDRYKLLYGHKLPTNRSLGCFDPEPWVYDRIGKKDVLRETFRQKPYQAAEGELVIFRDVRFSGEWGIGKWGQDMNFLQLPEQQAPSP